MSESALTDPGADVLFETHREAVADSHVAAREQTETGPDEWTFSTAYLVSQYPAISHTFILREIRRLRRLGARISVCSINSTDREPEALTAEEREEAAATYYLKAHGLAGACIAHAATLLRHPIGYVGGLCRALALAGPDVRKVLYQLFYFVEAVMLGHWMRSRGHGHVHVHFATPASTVAMIASAIFPIRYSITVHGPDEFYDAPGYKLRDKISGAEFICCIGTYARSQLMKLSEPEEWHKFEISPLGVDPEQFAPVPREVGEHFEIICVGRLVPAKGQHILLAAVARLVAAGREVRLRVVGDGPDMTSLKVDAERRGIGEQIVFEGAVNQDRIRELYASANVFALASFAEGIPVVLMEAMAMEIPCVTTFITGHPELIRHDIDGLLVAPSDDAELAEALAGLMDDPARRERLAKAGRARVIDKYNLNGNTDRLGCILERRLTAVA